MYILFLTIQITLITIMFSLGVFQLIISTVKEGPYNRETWAKRSGRWITMTWLRFMAWKLNGKIVILKSFDDDVYLSIAYKEFDTLYYSAYVYTTTHTGMLHLHEDGTVTRPEGVLSYIKNWLPLDLEERTFMIFQGAEIFDIVVN